MCCVGTKLVMRDFYYLVKCFGNVNATTEETAVIYKELSIDTMDHMFARDNFQSMLRFGAIKRTEDGRYYLADSQCEHLFQTKCKAWRNPFAKTVDPSATA